MRASAQILRFVRGSRWFFLSVCLGLSSGAYSAPPKLSGVYCPLLAAPQKDPQQLDRLLTKSEWRRRKILLKNGAAPDEIVFLSNLERRAGQMGGKQESADPSDYFKFSKNDPLLPAGMPAGVYSSNSGKYFYRYDSFEDAHLGGQGAAETFEFVYQHRLPDGRIVAQSGEYAAPDSSWGWDGRFEIQTDIDGRDELVITQGAMELPRKLRGANADAGDLPKISRHNYARTRHVFKVEKFENGKLYVIDQGSILGMEPDATGDWISYQAVRRSDGATQNLLKHAHGYGENFIPDPKDTRRMWKDDDGYVIRIFDMVVEEVHVEWPGGRIEKIPSKTRAIGYRMDPRDPSKKVAPGTLLSNGKPADAGIVFMSEELPGRPGSVAKSARRGHSIAGAKVLEVRTVNMDGTVTVEKNPTRPITISLVEGFNPVAGEVTLPSGKRVYLGTYSAGEYTWGGILENGDKPGRYGTYIGYRLVEEGRVGPYRPVTELRKGEMDFLDHFEDLTEYANLIWGIGRPQAYKTPFGKWRVIAHAGDGDTLRKGLPKAGYPASHKDFDEGYRRMKIDIPIRWGELNGEPVIELNDLTVREKVRQYRRNSPKN